MFQFLYIIFAWQTCVLESKVFSMQLNHTSTYLLNDVSALIAAACICAFQYTELDEAIFQRGTKKKARFVCLLRISAFSNYKNYTLDDGYALTLFSQKPEMAILLPSHSLHTGTF